MGRQSNLSYQAVANYCLELIAAGEKPSVRKIHGQFGGSFSTISELYHRWTEERRLAVKETELSDSFRQAILAEFGRVTLGLRQTLEQQIEQGKIQFQEAQELLKEYELKIEKLSESLAGCKKSAEAEKLKARKGHFRRRG